MALHDIPQQEEHLADTVLVHQAQQEEDDIDAEQMLRQDEQQKTLGFFQWVAFNQRASG